MFPLDVLQTEEGEACKMARECDEVRSKEEDCAW